MPEHNNSEQINLDQAVNEPHAYYRVFDAKTRNSITAIAEKISADSLVLDLGAGSGVLGEYLSTEKNCIVDGIDLNLQETKHSDCYRKIQSANLETQSLATLLSDQYDVIVCADLLEHLRSPQQLLVQLKDFVKADGSILLSVPNVSHIGLVSDLIEGAFEYRSEGLLDATHLRFFTRYSLNNLLHESGLRISSIETIELDPGETEFNQPTDAFPPKLVNLLVSRADALTYQFIVDVEFDDQTALTQIEEEQLDDSTAVSLSYSAQLFWRREDQNYDHSRSVTANGRIGEEKQQLTLPIPALEKTCSALRVELADRPGYVRVHAIKLHDDTGHLVWEWNGNTETLLVLGSRQNIEIADLAEDPGAAVVLLGSADSYFELPIPAYLLEALLNGGSLQLTQSFPMSADYLALAPRLMHLSQAQTQQIDELKQLIALRDSELAVRDATIKAHAGSPEEREKLIVGQQHEIEELKHLAELQAQQIEQREQFIDERDQWLVEKQDKAEQQYQKIQALEALMREYDIDITRRTSNVAFREQAIGQQLQIRDDSIGTLSSQIDELQLQLEYRLSMRFWLKRPLVYLRDSIFNKQQ